MVTLINIKKNHNIIECDYYPEGDEKDIGHMIYDIKNEKIIKLVRCNRDKDVLYYAFFNKVIRAIEDMDEKNNWPEEYVYMWY